MKFFAPVPDWRWFRDHPELVVRTEASRCNDELKGAINDAFGASGNSFFQRVLIAGEDGVGEDTIPLYVLQTPGKNPITLRICNDGDFWIVSAIVPDGFVLAGECPRFVDRLWDLRREYPLWDWLFGPYREGCNEFSFRVRSVNFVFLFMWSLRND